MFTLIKTINQILTAGIAITTFSLLLYASTFNLRDRVARSFALIMGSIVIVFTAEALGSNASATWEVEFWFHIQWIGLILLPPAYFQFSDALLSTTGKPSQWRRRWLSRLMYIVSAFFLISLAFSILLGPLITDQAPAPYFEPTPLTLVFLVFYFGAMILAGYNLARAYQRSTTSTSRRRMIYLITGALATALGSFPYLLFGAGFAARHSLLFWVAAVTANLFVGVLGVLMAYSVAFFGVSWPDRVVKSRLLKWIMRGPVTASVTLALVTIVRRTGELFGSPYTALVPIIMIVTILLLEYLITLFGPFLEKWIFFGKDRTDLELLRKLEDHLLTENDLRQFLEAILASVCDHLQASGAYIASLNGEKLELVMHIGRNLFDPQRSSSELLKMVRQNHDLPDVFQWGDDYLLPLMSDIQDNGHKDLIGLLGISGLKDSAFDEEQKRALNLLTQRAILALQDRRTQRELFRTLQTLTPQMDLIQQMRAASRFNDSSLLKTENSQTPEDMVQWVKEALGHYWGGPRLTESPLLNFKIVQDKAQEHDGNTANALRAILREAIERSRPEGERRMTGEWLLYNILEMKFVEGHKVRQIAQRLAVSEADLYRKQRIAIEAVAKAIMEMEAQAKNGSSQNSTISSEQSAVGS